MQTKMLTEDTYMDASERERALAEVAAQSAATAKWLGQLIERAERLTGEGNAYGELYTPRQYGLAVAPIVSREVIRARMLAACRDRGLTLVEIAEKIQLPPMEVVPHMVALRRRGQLLLERVEDETTPVYKTAEQGEAS
jgi:hypothetical protein